MTTNIYTQSHLGKFGELLFVRQRPQIDAEKHQGLLDAFISWRARRAAEAELNQMSDRDLADIGVARPDIKRAVRTRRPFGF